MEVCVDREGQELIGAGSAELSGPWEGLSLRETLPVLPPPNQLAVGQKVDLIWYDL